MSDLLPPELLWLTLTLVVFAAAEAISAASKRHPLAHPILLSAPVLMGALLLTRTPYVAYAEGTRPLTFLLGPAVVGLAVPIWSQRRVILRLARPLAAALAAGCLTAIVSAVGIAWLFGAPPAVLASVATRAATTPVAMEVSRQLGGVASLAAVIVLFAGVIGGVSATHLLNAMKIRDWRARGFAVGVSAHGFGAARAFQVNAVAGTFASLGMALNAVGTALVLSIFAVIL